MRVSIHAAPSPPSLTGAAWVGLVVVVLVKVVLVQADQEGLSRLFGELQPESRSYGELPNMARLVAEASNSTDNPGITRHADSQSCDGIVVLTTGASYTFSVTQEVFDCSAFIEAPEDSKLALDVVDVRLGPCDQEYLYINDGETLESTLCEIEAPVGAAHSRFLLLQYERRAGLRTPFSITVKAVPATSSDVVVKEQIIDKQVKDFDEQQICQSCGFSGLGAGSFRILGGAPAREKEYPWMVGIHTVSHEPNAINAILGNCGGSILDRRHVLTAAHCLTKATKDQSPPFTAISVVAGSIGGYATQKADRHAQVVKVDTWYTHPLYDRDVEEKKGYDIAVVRLAEDLKFNNLVSPVCLASPKHYIGSDVTVTGYGFVLKEGGSSRKLQEVKLTVRPAHECDEKYKHFEGFQLRSFQMCLHAPDKDSCRGDSGGPVVIRWKKRFHQVGIVSFGYSCNNPTGTRHGVYARVSSFIPWIKAVLNNTRSC